MFTIRSHARNVFTSLPCRSRCLSTTVLRSIPAALKVPEGKVSRRLEASLVDNPQGPVAEQLAATGLWSPIKRGPQNKSKAKAKKVTYKADKTRLNITGEKLCDDIISYIGKSLKRHKGCDIIDLYPGAGLWSQKLHNYLEPRSHILMEPDVDVYRPFLQPLLEQPGTTLVPKSGIIWRDLASVLTPEYLPHQPGPGQVKPDERNDTLLVTANLGFHPKKRYQTFESVATLLLHQFIDAIRTSGLFQKYGLVRMLIWTRTDDMPGLIPRSVQKRKRAALEAELLCDHVHEVCGSRRQSLSWYIREEAITKCSATQTLRRMRKARVQMPPGRETEAYEEAVVFSKTRRKREIPGEVAPSFKRPYQEKLAELEAAHTDELFPKDTSEYKAMQSLTWRTSWETRKHQGMLKSMQILDAIGRLRASGASTKELAAREAEWIETVQNFPKGYFQEFMTYKDNIHYFRQSPPLLHWDRREYEPMMVEASEFFPHVECSLLDIQPKTPHPLLRQTGPNSSRAADSFELIMSSLLNSSTEPLQRGLDALWPGAADYILPHLKGGSGAAQADLKYAELTPRLLSARQWEEMLELWMEWPFRPQFHELLGRTQESLPDKYGSESFSLD
ncbi:S-adenosyl-L-methionine-dependent methyltransferase [Xylariaceae sp. FL0016]|nr:S-adenosyl-L-methionine-dependent methyltransferase [Xylariaceae sp. FL0016]